MTTTHQPIETMTDEQIKAEAQELNLRVQQGLPVDRERIAALIPAFRAVKAREPKATQYCYSCGLDIHPRYGCGC